MSDTRLSACPEDFQHRGLDGLVIGSKDRFAASDKAGVLIHDSLKGDIRSSVKSTRPLLREIPDEPATLRSEVMQLRRENVQLREENLRMRQQREQLKAEVERLRSELAALKAAA